MDRTNYARIAAAWLCLFAAISLACGEPIDDDTSSGCADPPDEYKGEPLTGCAGAVDDDIRCCSYDRGFEEGTCYYQLCRDECRGEWEEHQFQC